MEDFLQYFSCKTCCSNQDEQRGATTIVAAAEMDYSTQQKVGAQELSQLTEEPDTAYSPGVESSPEKQAAQSVPAPPAQDSVDTFYATLQKFDGLVLGLDLSLNPGTHCRVTGVALTQTTKLEDGSPGEQVFTPVGIWNQNAEENRKIFEGDLILEVNGISGHAKQMLEQLKRDSSLNLLIKKRKEFIISILKGDDSIGLDVQCSKLREGLLVNKVKEGAVQAWNEANPDRSLNTGDRIVRINGMSGEPKELLRYLKESTNLDLTIVPS